MRTFTAAVGTSPRPVRGPGGRDASVAHADRDVAVARPPGGRGVRGARCHLAAARRRRAQAGRALQVAADRLRPCEPAGLFAAAAPRLSVWPVHAIERAPTSAARSSAGGRPGAGGCRGSGRPWSRSRSPCGSAPRAPTRRARRSGRPARPRAAGTPGVRPRVPAGGAARRRRGARGRRAWRRRPPCRGRSRRRGRPRAGSPCRRGGRPGRGCSGRGGTSSRCRSMAPRTVGDARRGDRHDGGGGCARRAPGRLDAGRGGADDEAGVDVRQGRDVGRRRRAGDGRAGRAGGVAAQPGERRRRLRAAGRGRRGGERPADGRDPGDRRGRREARRHAARVDEADAARRQRAGGVEGAAEPDHVDRGRDRPDVVGRRRVQLVGAPLARSIATACGRATPPTVAKAPPA